MVSKRLGMADRGAWFFGAGILMLCAAFLYVTNIPYVTAKHNRPPDAETRYLLGDQIDAYWYLAAARNVSHGLTQGDRWTVERNVPNQVSIIYPVGGWIAKLTGLKDMLVYHALRVLASIVLVLSALYFFMGVLRRRWAALLATGLALWFPPQVFHVFLLPEAIPTLSASWFSHFALSQAGVLLCFGSLLRIRSSNWRTTAIGALGVLLAAISHPYLLLPFFVTALLTTGWLILRDHKPWRRRLWRLRYLLVTGLTFLPFAAYQYVQLHQWLAFGWPYDAAPIPYLGDFIRGFAPLIAAAVPLGIWTYVRRPTFEMTIPWLWLVTQIPLLFGFNLFLRRYAEALVYPFVAVSLLSVITLAANRRRSIAGFYAAAAALFAFLVWYTSPVANNFSKSVLYTPSYENRLYDNLHQSDRVLAGDNLANSIPAWSDATVVLGRYNDTIQYPTKVGWRQRLINSAFWDQYVAGLRQLQANALVVDTRDASFTIPDGITANPCLHKDYVSGSITLYRVKEDCLK